jgi:hypothetical protein
MSQDNHDGNSHAANTIADAIAFADGKVYTSQHEFWNDCKNPRYKNEALYHALVEAKFQRSFGGAQGAEGVKAIPANGGFRRVQTSRNEDGSGNSTLIGLDGHPVGSRSSDDDSGGNSGSPAAPRGPVQVQTLAGGARRVTLRSGDAAEVRRQLPKEKQPRSTTQFSQHEKRTQHTR